MEAAVADRFGVVGISHRRASAEELSRCVRRAESPAALPRLLGVDEAVCLSTCNRIEIYFAARPRRPADEVLRAWSAWLRPDGAEELLLAAGYALNGAAAAKHLFSVLCGLDSLVLGDEQIAGQFRRSLAEARSAGACGPWLSLLGDEGLKFARRARASVDFGGRPTSVAEVAVQSLREHARGGAAVRVVLVGSGSVVRAAAARLKGWKRARLHFVNRTELEAEALAAFHGGSAQSLAAFQESPCDFDALLAATSAPHALVLAEHLAGLPAPQRPRLLLDLGMPANVDPALGAHPHYQRLDVLELGRRAAAGAEEARRIERQIRPQLREALRRLCDKLQERDLAPGIEELRRAVEARAAAELDRWLEGPLRHLAPAEREAVSRLCSRVAEQTVQVPSALLRELAHEPRVGPRLLAALCPRAPRRGDLVPGNA